MSGHREDGGILEEGDESKASKIPEIRVKRGGSCQIVGAL